MKNLYLNLAFYEEKTFMGKIAKWINSKARWMPCGALNLYRYNFDGSTKSVVFHEIDIAFGKYYFRIQKILPKGTRKDPHWKFENLTGK